MLTISDQLCKLLSEPLEMNAFTVASQGWTWRAGLCTRQRHTCAGRPVQVLRAAITNSMLNELTSGSLIQLSVASSHKAASPDKAASHEGMTPSRSASVFSKFCCIGTIQCSQFGLPEPVISVSYLDNWNCCEVLSQPFVRKTRVGWALDKPSGVKTQGGFWRRLREIS